MSTQPIFSVFLILSMYTHDATLKNEQEINYKKRTEKRKKTMFYGQILRIKNSSDNTPATRL